jgi:hypothetical protein
VKGTEPQDPREQCPACRDSELQWCRRNRYYPSVLFEKLRKITTNPSLDKVASAEIPNLQLPRDKFLGFYYVAVCTV